MLKWQKQLSASDAQRKLTGNQRGGITLVKARHPINTQRYFRYDLFGDANWIADETNTGEEREDAHVAMDTVILGAPQGYISFHISYSKVREAGQDNYTCILHTAPIAGILSSQNVTDSWLTILRTDEGGYCLSITADKPS